MAEETRVYLSGIPFLMNEEWLRMHLLNSDIRRPWKVVILRKGWHRSKTQWANAFLWLQFERRSPGGGHKPGWPYLARLVEALQSGTSMDRSKLALAFWLQILYKPVCVEDCCKLVDLSW